LKSIGLSLGAAVFAATLFAAAAANSAGGTDVGGIWLTQAGDAKIRVSHCGAGLCGTVVWLRDPIDGATGKPQIDDKNENPAMRNRRIIGISLFIGMHAAGPRKWSGQIYNADDGKTFQHGDVPGGRQARGSGLRRQPVRFGDVVALKLALARVATAAQRDSINAFDG
jgi:uncharacterized protein (DUF2147 family)